MVSFSERVYSICRRIPRGRVATYKAIADALGVRAYRAVGNSLNRNPYAPFVPCHRVVCCDGRLGGFASGSKKKADLLALEGVFVRDGRVVDFKKQLFCFNN